PNQAERPGQGAGGLRGLGGSARPGLVQVQFRRLRAWSRCAAVSVARSRYGDGALGWARAGTRPRGGGAQMREDPLDDKLPLLQPRSGLQEVRHVEALDEPPLPACPAAAGGGPGSSSHAAPRPLAPASLTAPGVAG